MASGRFSHAHTAPTYAHADPRHAHMKPIDWSPEFRLAVIEKIAMRMRDGIAQKYCDVDTIHFVAFMGADFLSQNVGNIESALGCTLQEVKEEMERNGK